MHLVFSFRRKQVLQTSNPALRKLKLPNMRVHVLATLLNYGASGNIENFLKLLSFCQYLLLRLVDLFLEFLHVLDGLLQLIPVENLRQL